MAPGILDIVSLNALMTVPVSNLELHDVFKACHAAACW
jgi:hypothetical protein